MTNKKKPAHEIRLGRIKAAVWAKETEKNGPRYSVTLCRLYKKEGEASWSFSDSFDRDDLPLLAKVADLAHTWIFTNSAVASAEAVSS